MSDIKNRQLPDRARSSAVLRVTKAHPCSPWWPAYPGHGGAADLNGCSASHVPVVTRRPLRRGRFVLNGLTYDASGVASIAALHEGEPLEVRLDLSDISVAWIEDPLNGEWVPVHCVQSGYARGVSFEAHLRLVEDFVRSGSPRRPWDDAETATDPGVH